MCICFYRYHESSFYLSCLVEEIMIKGTFSRNAPKLPLLSSSKKPSLASLAQKLQGVDLNSTPSTGTECVLPGDGLSNLLLPNSFTEDSNSVSLGSGKYTRTTVLVCDVGTSVPENVDAVSSLPSRPISGCRSVDSAVAACISKKDGSKTIGECFNVQNKYDAGGCSSWNDCSLEFGGLYINPAPHKRCRFSKPSPFGQTLSAVSSTLNRSDRRQQKSALHARFSYFRQTGAVAGMCRRHYSSNAETVIPFDFTTPSPDDIVRQKQKLAFGKRITSKRST